MGAIFGRLAAPKPTVGSTPSDAGEHVVVGEFDVGGLGELGLVSIVGRRGVGAIGLQHALLKANAHVTTGIVFASGPEAMAAHSDCIPLASIHDGYTDAVMTRVRDRQSCATAQPVFVMLDNVVAESKAATSPLLRSCLASSRALRLLSVYGVQSLDAVPDEVRRATNWWFLARDLNEDAGTNVAQALGLRDAERTVVERALPTLGCGQFLVVPGHANPFRRATSLPIFSYHPPSVPPP
jgi:hypothetical protein